MAKRAGGKRATKRKAPAIGRPPLDLDEAVIARLAQAGCSVTDIAHVVGCHRDTLYARFPTLLEQNDARGKVALRLKQHSLALEGNPTMLVWVGKNRLGQADKQEIAGPNGQPLQIERPPIAQAEREEQAKELLRGVFERAAQDDPEFAAIWLEYRNRYFARRIASNRSRNVLAMPRSESDRETA